MANMDITQKIPVTLSVFAADGITPAKFDTPIAWVSSDETIMTGAPDADGLTGFGMGVAPGAAHFTWTGVVGPNTITKVSEDVVVSAVVAAPASISDIFGAPVPKV